MIYVPAPRSPLSQVTITPFHPEMGGMSAAQGTAPTSAAWANSNKARFFPIYLIEPFTVLKAFWCNGATVGTDSIDIGAYQMTDMTTGRLDLIRSTGPVLSAGTVSVVQGTATWKTAHANITSGNDSTDRSSAPGYTTASVTLKAGRLYLMSVENSAASAAVVSAITGGGTWASRSSVQYNTAANRTSIWSCVPTSDYTGTIDIAFGATQTGCCWALEESSGVDTATTDGVVQQATGTGSSVTPLATLGAFGSANNATFAAHGHAAATATTPGTGFTETADVTTATPAQALETEWQVGNDTTADATITSAAWGSCAVEIKVSTASFVIPPVMPGVPTVYMGMAVSGTTATFIRTGPNLWTSRLTFLENATAFPLPSSVIPVAAAASGGTVPVAGFSQRTLLD